MISLEPESGSSGGGLRMFDPSYSAYSSHASPYPDYSLPSKLEAFDYAYWPTATTTHNLLANPMHSVLDQIQTPPSCSQAIETLIPLSPVHLSQISTTATISSTHHHHHIHQHLYPPAAPQAIVTSTPPTTHDPSQWLGSGDYQALNPSSNPSQYRHYSTPCSFYPTNNFYDPSSSQWPTSSALPIKFESPGSPPSYIESSNSIHPFPEHTSKGEQSDLSSYQCLWSKPSSSSQPPPVPPRNPLNGKTRERHLLLRLTFPRVKASKGIDLNTRFHIGVRPKLDRSVNTHMRNRSQ